MKDVVNLILELAEENVNIYLEDSKLKIDTPGGMPVDDIIARIRPNKDRIIEYLSAARNKKAAVIPAVAAQDDYAVSSSQKRLWILSQLQEASIAYNMPAAYLFTGSINQAALQQAFEKIQERHEMLRTVFRTNAHGQLRQVVRKPGEVPVVIHYHDLRQHANQQQLAQQLLDEAFTAPFDLANGPLTRQSLVQLEDEKWIFQYTMHHIISDGWSMGVFIKELLYAYNSYAQGIAPVLPPMMIQYKDYAHWQQHELQGPAQSTHKNHWLAKFEGEIPVLELPADRMRPALKTYDGDIVTRTINAALTRQIKKLGQEQGATLFMSLLAVVKALLYRYTAQEDIVLGSPVAGREHADLEAQIGPYINTLALRTQFSGAQPFKKLLQAVKETALEAYRHQAYPFDELVEQLDVRKDMSRHPLFDVMVVLQNTEGGGSFVQKNLGGLGVDRYASAAHVISKFDLLFDFSEQGEELKLGLEFNTAIYNRATIERMATHLVQLLQSIVNEPATPLGLLNYLEEAEKAAILKQLDYSAVQYEVEETLVSMFEQQAAATPERTAVKFGETTLTYRQLNEKANQLADYLKQQYHLQPEDRVVVKLEKSEWMIVSLLAVLKACAAYVPVDPVYPQDRIDYMIADSQCKLVIDDAELEKCAGLLQSYSSSNAVEKPLSGNLAYVIYTSGTTGLPKGSLVEHGNLTRLFRNEESLFDFNESDVWTMFHSFCFDFSVWEMYGALLFGGTLVVVPSDLAKDPSRYLDLLIEEGVTVLNQTPSAFYNIIKQELERPAALLKLRYVIFGGEALSPVKLKEWAARYAATALINMYGITETTVHVTYKKITSHEIETNSSNIGKPIPTLSCYVLDANGQVLPYGVSGELYVGGKGVCRGYLNRAELTAARFVNNPFGPGKLYRSGDKVRLLQTGELQYEGRIDSQVKVRGYRIELGEIQNVLAAHEQVDASAVITRDNQAGEKELVAYVVGKAALNIAELRRHLSRQLPAYMLPHYYVEVPAIPLTSNGKVDSKRLPEIESTSLSTGVEYVAPTNATEVAMCTIWEQVLGREKIGLREGFFELGGDSIKVLRMLTEVKKVLGIPLSINDVYSKPTIEELLAHYAANSASINRQDQLGQAGREQVEQDIALLKAEVLNQLGEEQQQEIEDIYPMSDIEKGMVYESLMAEDAAVYNCISTQRKIFEKFELDTFGLALELMARKHSILRTGFNMNDYRHPVQIVYRNPPMEVEYKDLSALAPEEQTEIIRRHIHLLQQSYFNFANPPWSMSIFDTGNHEIVFVFQAHHAIVDGWSVASFTTELNNTYLQLQQNGQYRPEPLKATYRDFIIQHEADKTNEQVKDFWRKDLAGFERLNLFTQQTVADNHGALFNAPLLEQLRQSARLLNTTPKIISLSAYLYLVKLLGYTNDVLVGLVTNTRPACEDGDRIIGCFLNTIPLRINLNGQHTTAQLVALVQQKLNEIKANETLSTIEIASLHNQPQNGNPFFDVLFNYVDFHVYGNLLPETQAAATLPKTSDSLLVSYGSANTHLDFTIDVSGGRLLADVLLRRQLKCGFTAERIASLYQAILSQMLQAPHGLISQAELVSENERRQLLVAFNQTEADFPQHQTLFQLFESAVEKFPGRTALQFEGSQMTYEELNKLSNQLADYLRKNYEILANDLVAILLPRSEWMIASILAVLKAGGAYVPIDPEYPYDRIDYIFTDSNCRLLLNEEELDRFRQQRHLYETGNPLAITRPVDLAYVIYTSGSTGRPKGVMIEHRSAVNLITAQRNRFGIGETENILQFSTISFDASVEQIFLALTTGAKLTIPSRDIIADAEKLTNFIATYELTHIHIVPAILKDVTAGSYKKLNRVIAGGDVCAKELAEKWAVHHQFYNEYGPTETTVTAIEYLYGEAAAGNVLPIGRPLANTFVYILNERGQLSPIGLPGEICIGGAGVARGYLNRPELTAEKFVSNPFRPGERMYRTGDLGRWRTDGIIEFIGRVDEQVKIRGHRIEPGEIESLIAQYPGVTAAAVTTVARNGERELAAYVVAEAGLDKTALRTFLQEKLPAYMVPAYLVELYALPLSLNGKVDKKRLPQPNEEDIASGKEHVGPRTETEEKLLQIWSEVLGIEPEKISVTDNFFELGGHSLKATRLAGQLYRALDVKLDLKELFLQPEIAQQAKLIEQAMKMQFFAIEEAPGADSYPLSASQRRLWVLSQLQDANAAYNMPGANVFEGNLDVHALSYAFDQLLARHESLRTVFRLDSNGEARQFILPKNESGFAIDIRDLRSIPQAEQTARLLVEQDFARSFDLGRGPLMRAGLYQVADSRWFMSYVMHHIISDGWSMQVLIRELMALYVAYTNGTSPNLRDLRIQYKDYAVWQQQQLSGTALQLHRAYWLDHFSGTLPVVDLPSDKPRPAVKTYNGSIASTGINAELYKGLQALSQRQGTTLFMTLLGVVNVLLYKYTGQQDITIGTPVAVREHPDLEDQIGFYANTLALRTRFAENENFYELLERVRKMTLGAYEHQVYPFDQLVGDLQLLRDRSRHPLFDIQVILQNDSAEPNAAINGDGGLWMKQYADAPVQASVFDLVFHFHEGKNGLYVVMTYNSDVYSSALVNQLGNHLSQLTEQLLRAPGAALSSIDFLAESESTQLVQELNDTSVHYNEPASLPALFAQQVAQRPNSLALQFEDNKLTYAELDAVSSRLAKYLLAEYQLAPEDKVAVMLNRSHHFVIAILAVLKTGAAYVPIDAQYPDARKTFMLQDAAARLLLTQTDFIFNLDYYQGAVFAMDVQLATLNDVSQTLPVTHDPKNLAYIIYTSGSTGRPKGVMIEHGAIANTILSQRDIFGVQPGFHHLQFAAASFDASVSEIFVALCSGGSLHVISDEEKKEPANLLRFMQQHEIDIATIPPAYLQLLDVAELKGLQRLVTAGEAAVKNTVQAFAAYGDYFNAYGPTETSICASIYKNPTGGSIATARVPIGRAIANTNIYILNRQGQLCAKGVAGEICVSGPGIARGYLNRDELTAEKFTDDPFRAGYRLYRTGDLGRWNENGQLEFLGRVDEQVKLRGYRIEPGEIESLLRAHQNIQQAAVAVQTNSADEQELVAYVVCNSEPDIAALRNYLAQSLPAYMLPQQFVALETLPLNSSGKIDRGKLPALSSAASGLATYQAARTETEAAVIAVFEEVLRKKPIGVKDDFFVLGGDSIKSIQVVSRLKQKGYSLNIQDVLMHPVVEELCKEMGTATRSASQSAQEGIISLSPIQRYFFESDATAPDHYNQSVLLSSRLPLSEEGLQQCLAKLVVHHDALRMVFRKEKDGWIQENLGLQQGFGWQVKTVATDEQLTEYCTQVQSSPDLASGPLFRACLFRSAQGAPDRLLLVAHHLVVDGVSWRILLEDLSELYQQYSNGLPLQLPPKTDSFAAWQQQQENFAASNALQQEVAYWDEIEQKALAAQPLQPTKPGDNKQAQLAQQSFVMDAHTTGLLVQRCYAAYRTGINDILIAALAAALHETFGLSQLLLKLEGHGREDIGGGMDVTRTVGWFTTTYPVVVACSNNLQQQLIEAKEALHKVPNKGIGYGILRYMAGRPYNAQPWLSFNYLGDFGDGAATHSGEQLFNYSTLNRGAEVDGARARDVLLDVTGLMAEGCLRVNIGYSHAQFDDVRMQELMDAYRRQLETLVNWLSQQKQQQLTPSDLTYQNLSLAELQALEAAGPVEDVYELSPLQQGLYYHWVSAKEAAAYFMQTNCTIKGALNAALLNDAYNRLVQRHSILRSHFTEQAGVLLQVVKKEVAAAIEYIDVSASADVQEAVAAYKAADKLRGFDLSAGSQMRLAVLHTGNDTFEFVWSHHHILMDGWCGGILIKEFFTIYDSLLANREPALPAVNGYAAYIKWLRTVDKNASLAYWKDYLQGYVNSNRLWEPARELTAGRKPYQPLKRKFELPLQLSTAVKTLVASLGVTESTFVQVIWSLLVGAHTNSNDVVFGSVVSGRPAELKGVEEMIGLFSNTVPVRLQWNNELTVDDLLKQAQQQWIAGSKHHYVQLADVQAQSALGRELFNQVMVTENFPVQEMLEQSTEGSGSLSFLASDVFDQTNYDFTLTVRPGGQTLQLCIDCDANLYDAAQIATIERHFLQLVQQVVAQPGATLGALQLLSEEERSQLLHSFNDTTVDYDATETLVSLFEKQVLATPAATAVVFEGNSLTYAQLNEHANRLAVHLQQEYGVAAGKLVSIMMRRSHHMMVAILAVLKAGAAYVPVDVEHPRNRKEFMLADSASPLVLTESEYMFELDYFSGQVFALDVQLDALPPAPATWQAIVQPSSLAYVIYTSGSTGKPKGVMIEHGAIANTIQSQCEIFDVQPGFNHLQFASASFDASVSEMFVALCSGGTLCIINDADKKDAAQLLQFINSHAVDIATIPPAYMQLLEAADLQTLKRLVTAGEAVAKSRVENFADYGDYYNAYGPTETSICATIFKIPKGHQLPHARLPIGKPIANTSVYILNEHNQLCPPGAPGEICVSGRGLARGYWNQPGLTAEKFVDNPFAAGTRMYKTGDLGRWLPCGEIEFIGRKDAQVKIRGHRIEPGEVEAVLQLHPQVSQAVAQVCEVAGTQQLVAYVVSTESIDAASLHGHVANWLPAYMLPDHFITIPQLPLNTSGKIDKAAMPLPEGMAGSGEYLAPRTATEQSLVAIWSEVLGIEQEKIGVRDNFFNLGGHSLKVIQLMARVRKQFEVNPGIDALFKNPTIEFLSGEIEKTQLVNAGSPQFENADNIENFQV